MCVSLTPCSPIPARCPYPHVCIINPLFTCSSQTSLPSCMLTSAPVLLATNTLRTQSHPCSAVSTVCLRGISFPALTPSSAVNTTLHEAGGRGGEGRGGEGRGGEGRGGEGRGGEGRGGEGRGGGSNKYTKAYMYIYLVDSTPHSSAEPNSPCSGLAYYTKSALS